MFKLKVIIGSTREGRKGPLVADWIYKAAQKNSEFETDLVDLAKVNLPLLDEPNHPRLQQYTKQHTKDWSAIIDPADAFILVTPEYNFGIPSSVKNALDFIYNEWNYKPMAFVSYGGISGGTRSVQMIKEVVTTLKMVPIMEAVNIPFFTKLINDNEEFTPTDVLDRSADVMMKELLKWCGPLKEMRKK